ncbi:phage tail sheath family protein [Streptomyces microflavus]|uniref:Phage tail sheath family protein n=1 Tax=Streptomyces microflavus TaxID=1919 RepID=A0A7H8MZX6_STRMI|nr:phage tail sheath C-terminal domain-containing protein [Streptomyces microflavus]QKW47696.1 phage tail sheath family protein [Streptomyces microflavus]
MAASAQYPGVYIQETYNHSLAVQSGRTAVTAFIGDFAGVPTGGVRVNDWLDFTELAVDDSDAGQVLGAVLKSYFQNGGGHCYLVSTAGSTLAEGLAAVSALGEVTILVAPGLWDQGEESAGEWARALTGWAADNTAMAILHTDRGHTPVQADAAVDTWGLDESQRPFAAVYYPWLRQSGVADPVAPSGAVAGAWTAVDSARGVWKAPANIVLRGIDGPVHEATDTDQGAHLNLNFIRTFSDMGTVIWGARTRSETDQWRYIPIRRLFSAVERDIQRALRSAVFEPNAAPTWERVRAAVDSYLHQLWQQGGLAGGKPGEAYFVQIGQGITMAEDDIAAGRLVLKVGLATMRPAEFTIVQFTQEQS